MPAYGPWVPWHRSCLKTSSSKGSKRSLTCFRGVGAMCPCSQSPHSFHSWRNGRGRRGWRRCGARSSTPHVGSLDLAALLPAKSCGSCGLGQLKHLCVVGFKRHTLPVHPGPWCPPARTHNPLPHPCVAWLSSKLDGITPLFAPLLLEGLNQVGIAREGLPRRRLIGPEERGDIVLLGVQSREVEPGKRVFEVPPDPLERVQLRTIGR